MDLHQTEDDQSFQDLLTACQEGFKRPRRKTSSTGPHKNGREQRKRNSTSSTSTSDSRDGDLIHMLGRLVLRQEDTLNQLGLDRSLMLFLQCGKGSLMPYLLEQGKKRTLHPCLPRLRLAWHALSAGGILTEDLKWQYLSWNPEPIRSSQ